MKKRQKKIMVWLIVWAGLLIAVLYSPIGSPDFYSSSGNYYVANQPATVKSGSIANAPKTNSEAESNSDELIIPEVSTISKTPTTVGRSQPGNTSTGGSSNGNTQTLSYQNNNSASGTANGGGSFIASGSTRNSAGTSGIIMTNGITTMSVTSTVNNTTKQSSTSYTLGTGATDPGDDPSTPPIPVGDGWGLLIFFGTVYVFIKKKYLLLKDHKNSI